jgi:hypothetical protein
MIIDYLHTGYEYPGIRINLKSSTTIGAVDLFFHSRQVSDNVVKGGER